MTIILFYDSRIQSGTVTVREVWKRDTTKLGRWALWSSFFLFLFFPSPQNFFLHNIPLAYYLLMSLSPRVRESVLMWPDYPVSGGASGTESPCCLLFTFLPRLCSRRKYLSAADGGVSVAHRRAGPFPSFLIPLRLTRIVSANVACKCEPDFKTIGRAVLLIFHSLFFSFFFIYAIWAFRHCWAEHGP